MILKIKLKNIASIKDEMVLDFIANKSDKKNIDSVFITDDNVWINRLVGIIAGNAHGKTTILDAIASIGSFIEMPLRKKSIPPLNNFNMDEIKEEYKEKILKEMITDFTNIELPMQNKMNVDDNSLVEIEMYINNKEYNTTGYYLYTIEYDKTYKLNGIRKEKLQYKNRYNKNYSTLFEISNGFESEIGYKIAYENNYINELEANKIDTSEFRKKILYYKTFIKHYNEDSNVIFANNYIFPEFYLINMIKKCKDMNKLIKLVKLADDNIEDIYIDEKTNDKKHIIFKYKNFELGYDDISTATKKLVAMAYSIIESNNNDSVLLIDELDNSLNLEISKFLLKIFSQQKNSMSQIIFTTNNPDTLNDLRRDQIFLILKNNYELEAINFYDFIDPITNKRVRKDFSFTKAYKNNVIDNFPSEMIKNEIVDSFF